MDETTLKTIPDYIQKLPQPVQDFVFAGVWEERTSEIAKKYSLSTEQSENLIDDTLLVLIGLLDPQDFISNLSTELNISKLLSSQIIEELETRVFEFAIKSIEARNKNIEKTKTENSSILPEIKPEILPATQENILPVTKTTESQDKPENIPNFLQTKVPPPPKPPLKESIPGKIIGDFSSKIKYIHIEEPPKQEVVVPTIPTPKPESVEKVAVHENKKELVQSPISVPRFTAVPVEDEEPEETSTQTPPIPTPPKPQEKTPPKDNNLPKPQPKYTNDPYREPIE